jgi:hypothetical protein
VKVNLGDVDQTARWQAALKQPSPAAAAHRIDQPAGMMDALGITRDLGADHARGVAQQFRAPDLANGRAPITWMPSEQAEGQSCGQFECLSSIFV